MASSVRWIHEPDLLRRLADSTGPKAVVAAELDVRPSPAGTYAEVADLSHDFWAIHPDAWVGVVTAACLPVAGQMSRARPVTVCGDAQIERREPHLSAR